jgi:hypothetical protein
MYPIKTSSLSCRLSRVTLTLAAGIALAVAVFAWTQLLAG